MADNRYKQVQAFNAPTAYDQQMVEARRRRRMAEALAQQAYVPQDVGVAPIPAAAPLVQGLQAFLSARAARKADEAEEKAAAEVTRTGEQIAGRLSGGAPVRSLAPADASGLQEVAVTSEYQRSPDDAMRVAMTSPGTAAVKGNPMLAAMLARTMEKPSQMEVGAVNLGDLTPDSARRFARTRNPEDIEYRAPEAKRDRLVAVLKDGRPTYVSESEAEGMTPANAQTIKVSTGGGSNEPLATVAGPDGKPMYVPRSQAVGKTPWTPRTAAQEIADVDRQRSIDQKTIDTQTAIDNIDQLLVHPGRISGTGASSFLSNIPGTDARGFQAQLETFKAQTFIPMVSALKGMGALSDAEGKKLSAAVGALDPSMPEAEFERELRKVQKTLYEKARAAGLNVVMPSANEEVIKLPPRPR
jgi:hypothetical protein